MSRFNTTTKVEPTAVNMAGGTAFKMTPELELVTALLTSFLNNSFYEKGTVRQDRLVELYAKVDPLFAAKAALYARNEYGMRSVSHVIAGEIAAGVKGEEWTKRFFEKVIYRPDDALEIFAYLKNTHNKKLSHALRKGIAKKLETLNNYQLAKYRAAEKDVKLVDLVNLTHPHANKSLTALVNDELRNENTWEAKVSAAGKSEDENAKSEAWAEMVKSGKIGYFALVRNLRNILVEAPEVIDEVCALLVDEKRIKGSLLLPFRFVSALREVEKISGVDNVRKVVVALNKALDISCANVPVFEGRTLIAVDTSGSMYPGWGNGEIAPIHHASVFGAIMAKANDADLMAWGDRAAYVQYNPLDSTMSIAKSIEKRDLGGTNMSCVFQAANMKYDRIVILTDEQSWLHNYYRNPGTSLSDYRKRLGANPMVYSWDLAGHGTLQFPENSVATLAGWSDKVFDIMKLVETDKKALIRTIEQIEI